MIWNGRALPNIRVTGPLDFEMGFRVASPWFNSLELSQTKK